MTSVDPYRVTDELDDAVLDAIATRLEARGRHPAFERRVPAPGRATAGIELDVSIGFGDTVEDAPESLRQAVRLLVSHWYDNRGVVASAGQCAVLPSTVAALIAPYRMFSI